MYVLTSEVNDYNQHGEYFETVFKDKPTLQELSQLMFLKNLEELDQHGVLLIVHIFNGGGRQDSENFWYNLHEVESARRIGNYERPIL